MRANSIYCSSSFGMFLSNLIYYSWMVINSIFKTNTVILQFHFVQFNPLPSCSFSLELRSRLCLILTANFVREIVASTILHIAILPTVDFLKVMFPQFLPKCFVTLEADQQKVQVQVRLEQEPVRPRHFWLQDCQAELRRTGKNFNKHVPTYVSMYLLIHLPTNLPT
jgi:hypothetical protein